MERIGSKALSSGGRLTIPSELRKEFNLYADSRYVIYIDGDGICINTKNLDSYCDNCIKIVDGINRVLIPKVLRDGLNISKNELLDLYSHNGMLILKPIHARVNTETKDKYSYQEILETITNSKVLTCREKLLLSDNFKKIIDERHTPPNNPMIVGLNNGKSLLLMNCNSHADALHICTENNWVYTRGNENYVLTIV